MKRAPDGPATSRTQQRMIVGLVPTSAASRHVALLWLSFDGPNKLRRDGDYAARQHSLHAARLDADDARPSPSGRDAPFNSQE